MRRVSAVLVALSLVTVPATRATTRAATRATTPAHSAPAVDPAFAARVDRYLRPYRDLALFQGVILVARGDRILLEQGYGDANVELRVPAKPGHVFRIASLSKPFTEVLLGRLVEEGRIDLSAPLSRYLPDFPRGDSITLDMLRLHRAGIPNMNSIPFDEEAARPNTLDSLVRAIARAPLDFAPGSRRRYSNGGYAVLAAVIERVTGEAYADALARRVLVPLGLTHTHHEGDGVLVPDRAYGYTVSPVDRHALVVAPFQQMATKTGGGSLVSTAGDLHRFLRAMYTDRAIRADTWRTLFPPDSTYSYQGRCPGFNLWMGRDFTAGVDVVVLCNDYAAGMVATVGEDLIAMARGREVAPAAWRADLAADSVRTRPFLATWRAAPGALPYGDGPFTVRRQAGELVLDIGDTPVDVLVPQGGDRYLLRNLWSEMRLVPDSAVATLRPLWIPGNEKPLARATIAVR